MVDLLQFVPSLSHHRLHKFQTPMQMLLHWRLRLFVESMQLVHPITEFYKKGHCLTHQFDALEAEKNRPPKLLSECWQLRCVVDFFHCQSTRE